MDARLLPPEDIGLLARPVEPEAWLSNVRSRYAFVTALDETEQRVTLCNPGDRYEVSLLVLALTGHEPLAHRAGELPLSSPNRDSHGGADAKWTAREASQDT